MDASCCAIADAFDVSLLYASMVGIGSLCPRVFSRLRRWCNSVTSLIVAIEKRDGNAVLGVFYKGTMIPRKGEFVDVYN